MPLQHKLKVTNAKGLIMLIEVTQDDINHGIVLDCYACPVAKAINRILLPELVAEVGNSFLWIYEDDRSLSELARGVPVESCYLPREVIHSICSFDLNQAIKPFSFELPIDQYCSNTLSTSKGGDEPRKVEETDAST